MSITTLLFFKEFSKMKKITSICIIVISVILLFGAGYFVGRSRNEKIESDLLVKLFAEKAYHGQTKLRAETAEDQCQYWLRVLNFWYFKAMDNIPDAEFKILIEKAGDIE